MGLELVGRGALGQIIFMRRFGTCSTIRFKNTTSTTSSFSCETKSFKRNVRDARSQKKLSLGPTYISADPGLGHGRGGAWDHRRCGTCFAFACLPILAVTQATALCVTSYAPFMPQQSQYPAAADHAVCQPRPYPLMPVLACRLSAVALSSYEGSSLPFASPQNPPKPAKTRQTLRSALMPFARRGLIL